MIGLLQGLAARSGECVSKIWLMIKDSNNIREEWTQESSRVLLSTLEGSVGVKREWNRLTCPVSSRRKLNVSSVHRSIHPEHVLEPVLTQD